jgi:hypothetical protein
MPEPDEQLTLFASGVRDAPTAKPHRPLTGRERTLLVGWCGTDNHPLIIEARRLFNATVVGIESADEKSPVGPDWVQMDLLDELQDRFRQSRRRCRSGSRSRFINALRAVRLSHE